MSHAHLTFLLLALTLSAASARIIYVDANSRANLSQQTGRSWPFAFSDLNTAIDQARDGDEIFIASGTYINERSGDGPAFTLSRQINLIGGFPTGGGEQGSTSAPTVLSGDIDRDDAASPALSPAFIRGLNSDSVLQVTASGCLITDLFISAGRDRDTPGVKSGGAGLRINGSSNTFKNCTIIGNTSETTGGGVLVSGNQTVFDACTIIANSSSTFGGGIHTIDADNVTFISCEIKGNSAGAGGGIHSENSTLALSNLTIAGNRASSAGGGLSVVSDSDVEISNTIFWSNSAGSTINSLPASFVEDNSSTVSITDSTVQGLVGTDPLFIVDPNPLTAPSPSGNLRLATNSPAINLGRAPIQTNEDRDGKARTLGFSSDQGAFETGSLLFVDANLQSGNNNGSSWENAFQFLQDALAIADRTTTIRLASHRNADGTLAGIQPHRPDRGAGQIANSTNSTFAIPEGTRLEGGYPAGGGPQNTESFPTVLSGHMTSSDQTLRLAANVNYRQETFFHFNVTAVAHLTSVDTQAAFDGLLFAIAHTGNAPNLDDQRGGAILGSLTNPTEVVAKDCEFWNFLGPAGGNAAISASGEIALTACDFVRNAVEGIHASGGICRITGPNSELKISDCLFRDNYISRQFLVIPVSDKGTLIGFDSPGGNVQIDNSIFDSNKFQGFTNLIGVLNFDTALIEQCEFLNTEVSDIIYAADGEQITVRRCLFEGNDSFLGQINRLDDNTQEYPFVIGFKANVFAERVKEITYQNCTSYWRAEIFGAYPADQEPIRILDELPPGASSVELTFVNNLTSARLEAPLFRLPDIVNITESNNIFLFTDLGEPDDGHVIDPLGPTFNLRPQPDSPLIDAGAAINNPLVPIIDGDNDGQATPDIGFYESDPASPPVLPQVKVLGIRRSPNNQATILTIETNIPYGWAVEQDDTLLQFQLPFDPTTPNNFARTYDLPAGISDITIPNERAPRQFYRVRPY